MLEQEIKYFNENRAAWLTQYPNKVMLVKDRQLVGAFDSPEEALKEGARLFGLTPFLVRHLDQSEKEIYIPALALGILNADPTSTV